MAFGKQKKTKPGEQAGVTGDAVPAGASGDADELEGPFDIEDFDEYSTGLSQDDIQALLRDFSKEKSR